MKIIMLVIAFLLIGAFFIAGNDNLHLANPAQLSEFAGKYYSWLFDIFGNTKSICGYVVKMDWLPSPPA